MILFLKGLIFEPDGDFTVQFGAFVLSGLFSFMLGTFTGLYGAGTRCIKCLKLKGERSGKDN